MSVLILSVFGIIILRVLFQFIDRHLFKRIRVPKKSKLNMVIYLDRIQVFMSLKISLMMLMMITCLKINSVL